MQPTPEVTTEDIERIVKRDFADADEQAVFALLDTYGSEDWHRETTRVRLASLKLAGGSIERLKAEIEVARMDYRDVLASAEYPAYMDHYHANMSETERQEIIDADWKQYRSWLEQQ